MNEQFTYDQAIKLFDIQQESILEITRLNAKAINAKTIQETDRIALKLDDVILRQDKINGSVAKNTKTTEKVNRFSGNVKWYIIGLFGFCYSVAWIYDSFNLKEIIEKLIFKL